MTITGRNNQSAVGRPGVMVYNPGRPPAPRPRPVNPQSQAIRESGMSLNDQLQAWKTTGAASSPGGGQEEEEKPLWGKGLGILIGNPIARAALKPLEMLDYGRRVVTLGAEEFAEGITGQEMASQLDENGDLKDTRSNMDKLKDVEYGVGQLLGDLTGNKWADRAIGFVGDVALDPLTYLTAGVGVAAGKSARAGALAKLLDAQRAANKAGDTARIAELGGREALERIGQRGVGVASKAQNEAMGLGQQGMRLGLTSRNSVRIPGTAPIARGVNEAFGAARPLVRNLPGAKTIRGTRNPTGFLGNDLGPALERVITGKGEGSVEAAIETVAMDDFAREVGQGFGSVATDELERVSAQIKDLSQDEVSEMIRRAEELGEKNIWTDTADKMREVASFFGAELPELEGGRYAMPHILSREFRNYIIDNADDGRVAAFRKTSGLTEQDLLEESGFLQRRSFKLTPDGKPTVIPIGDTEVTLRTGSIDELNRVLKEAFPAFDGEIYETDPITAYRRYIGGVKRDVAKRGAHSRAADEGFTNVQRTGAAPESFDPYSGGADVVGLDGSAAQRVIPAEGEFQPNEFFTGQTDDAATTARNKDILRSQKPLIQQYRDAAEGSRAAIAAQMEADAQELLDPARAARRTASDARQAAERRMGQAQAMGSGAEASRVEAREVIDEISGEIDRITKAEYNIQRSAKNRTKTAQKRLLDGLDARRKELIGERNRIRSNYRSMMTNVDESAQTAARKVGDDAAVAQGEVFARERATRDAAAASEEAARVEWKAPTPQQVASAENFLKRNKAKLNRYAELQEEARVIQKRLSAEDLGMVYDYKGQLTPDMEELARINESLLNDFDGVQRALSVINRDREFKGFLDLPEARNVGVAKGTAASAKREADDLRLATQAAPETATPAPRAATIDVDADTLAKRRTLVNSRRGQDLDVARTQRTNLQRQVGKRPSKASEKRLAKEIEAKDAEIANLERNGWGGKYDRAKAAIAQADAAPQAASIPKRNGIDHPLVQGAARKADEMARSGEAIKGRLANEQLAAEVANEADQATVASRIGAIGANADEEFTDIGARNREAATDKVEAMTPERERLVAKQIEYEDLVEEMDAITGDAQSAYLAAMADEAAMKAEHERIASRIEGWGVSDKGGKPTRIIKGERGGRPSKRAVDEVQAGDIPPAAAQPLYNSVEDMRNLLNNYPEGIDDPLVQRMAAALFANERQLSKLTTEIDIPLRQTEQIVKAAKDGTLAPVVIARLRDNWRLVWDEGDVVISREMDRVYRNLSEIQKSPKAFGRTLEAFTNFFKTYATLTPGFHVRNGMSASFMNFADGVPASTQMRGLKLWTQYSRSDSPLQYLKDLARTDPQAADAFKAAFASGTGGRFTESGFADATRVSGKVQERIFDNKVTRFSQRVGQDWVEGPVRLGMALDTTLNGGDVGAALQRVSRIHFDYSQVSQFDEKAKRVIPFWTFMSRNLPMQITMMWTKPRLYAQYNSFVRNFTGEPEPGTPEYFDKVGAFRFGDAKLGGMPLFLQPGFAHLDTDENMQKFTDILSGENVGRAFTDVNPIFTAPVEYATGRDLFTGREFEDTDLVPAEGIINTPLGQIARLLGLTKEGASGQVMVPEKFLSLANSINPLSDRTSRVLPSLATGNAGSYEGRQVESIARLLGAPVRQLSPQQQQSTTRGEFFDNQDKLALQRMLAQN